MKILKFDQKCLQKELRVGGLLCRGCEYCVATDYEKEIVVCDNTETIMTAVLVQEERDSESETLCHGCAFFPGNCECPGGKECEYRWVIKSFEEVS